MIFAGGPWSNRDTSGPTSRTPSPGSIRSRVSRGASTSRAGSSGPGAGRQHPLGRGPAQHSPPRQNAGL